MSIAVLCLEQYALYQRSLYEGFYYNTPSSAVKVPSSLYSSISNPPMPLLRFHTCLPADRLMHSMESNVNVVVVIVELIPLDICPHRSLFHGWPWSRSSSRYTIAVVDPNYYYPNYYYYYCDHTDTITDIVTVAADGHNKHHMRSIQQC